MVTGSSLGRDTRFNQAQKLQSWMAISAFKTCKVWFSLNPSICNSGFYRTPGSNIHFPFSVFFLFTTTLLISLFSKKKSLSSLFFASLSSQPIPSFYNEILVFLGNRWFPYFAFLWTEPVPCLSLGKSHFLFFLFFPSFSSDSFESPWLATFFGMCWDMPFSASPFYSSTFPFSFPYGRNPVLPTWKPPVIILFFVFLCSGSSRFFLLVPWEVAGFFWRLCSFALFLIFFFCLFLLSCLSLLLTVCLEESAPLDGCWGSWLLILLPCFFFFLLDASSSGLQVSWASLFLCGSLAPASLDLACSFPFGPDSLFWASLTMVLFRPQ